MGRAWASYTSDSRQRRHPSRRRRRIARGEAICTTPLALRGKQRAVYLSRYTAEPGGGQSRLQWAKQE